MSTVNVNRVVDASGGVLAPISSVMRNRIINGAMVVSQRNGTSSVNPSTGAYTLDRWDCGGAHDGVVGVQQVTDAPAGFINSLKFTVNTADASLASTQYLRAGQMVEGLNLTDFAWGTANATSITLSFWVKSSLTGTFGGYVTNSAENRWYVFSYTVSSANTWEQKTVTIAGDTSGTWLTTNGIGLRMYFSLGAGSTYLGSSGSWGTTVLLAPTGQTNVLATIGNTWAVTGVQLERGTQATSFEYRQYQQELALCQRYAQKISCDATAVYVRFCSGFNQSTTTGNFVLPFKTSMRTAPSLTTTGTASNYAIYNGAATISACTSVPSVGTDGTTTESASIAAVTTGLTAGGGSLLISNNTASAFLLFTSEL